LPKGEIEMLSDRIEREVRIDAPIDIVWSVVTEPEQITQWFSDIAEFERQPGAEGTLTFRGSRKGSRSNDSQGDVVINLRVERIEPPHYFSFRWDYPRGAEPDESNAPLVEFTLTEDGEATTLKLVESGLQRPGWTEDENDDYVADHKRGWDHHLGVLRAHANTRPWRVAR
jgi:uncharacterized protein YndB with AHSA1/START domain